MRSSFSHISYNELYVLLSNGWWEKATQDQDKCSSICFDQWLLCGFSLDFINQPRLQQFKPKTCSTATMLHESMYFTFAVREIDIIDMQYISGELWYYILMLSGVRWFLGKLSLLHCIGCTNSFPFTYLFTVAGQGYTSDLKRCVSLHKFFFVLKCILCIDADIKENLMQYFFGILLCFLIVRDRGREKGDDMHKGPWTGLQLWPLRQGLWVLSELLYYNIWTIILESGGLEKKYKIVQFVIFFWHWRYPLYAPKWKSSIL